MQSVFDVRQTTKTSNNNRCNNNNLLCSKNRCLPHFARASRAQRQRRGENRTLEQSKSTLVAIWSRSGRGRSSAFLAFPFHIERRFDDSLSIKWCLASAKEWAFNGVSSNVNTGHVIVCASSAKRTRKEKSNRRNVRTNVARIDPRYFFRSIRSIINCK